MRDRLHILLPALPPILLLILLSSCARPSQQAIAAKGRANEMDAKATLTRLREGVKAFHTDVGAYPLNLSDIQEQAAPSQGVSLTGGQVEVRELSEDQRAAFKGPYLEKTAAGELPICKLNGKNDASTWVYSGANAPPDKVGQVALGVEGKDLNGTPYTEW